MESLIWLILAGGTIAAVATFSTSSADRGPIPPTIHLVQKLKRVWPPPAPFIMGDGVPIVYFSIPGENRPVAGNTAIDATGEPWVAIAKKQGGWGSPVSGNVDENEWRKFRWGTSNDLTSVLSKIIDKAIPIIAIAAGALIGGVGGAVAAFAITTVYDLAKGMSITDAVVDGYAKNLSSVVESNAYYQTIKSYSEHPIAQSAIKQAREIAIKNSGYAGTGFASGVGKAFDAGLQVARARLVQQRTVQKLKTMMTDDEGRWIDDSMSRGVAMIDWVNAMFGAEGVKAMQTAMNESGVEIEAGATKTLLNIAKAVTGK